MSEVLTSEQWEEIGKRLRAPFDPDSVDFRPQGGSGANGRVQAVCFVDARVVQDRLDEVVGPGAWGFTYEPLVVDKGQVLIAKGRLAIHGVVKEDVGEASNFDPSKGCVSDALKRAAVAWGIGRYLYSIGGAWVTLNQYKQIEQGDVRKLRANLPRPAGAPGALPRHVAAPVADASERSVEPTPLPTRPQVSRATKESEPALRSDDDDATPSASASTTGGATGRSLQQVFDRAKTLGERGPKWSKLMSDYDKDPARIDAALDEIARQRAQIAEQATA